MPHTLSFTTIFSLGFSLPAARGSFTSSACALRSPVMTVSSPPLEPILRQPLSPPRARLYFRYPPESTAQKSGILRRPVSFTHWSDSVANSFLNSRSLLAPCLESCDDAPCPIFPGLARWGALRHSRVHGPLPAN